MGTRNFWKSSGETIHARAGPAVDFKNCCMLSGFHDGTDRDHFFQGVNSWHNRTIITARLPAVYCWYTADHPSSFILILQTHGCAGRQLVTTGPRFQPCAV